MKTCTRCRAEKPLTEFHRNKRSSDGRHSACKLCRSANPERYRPQGAPPPTHKACTRCGEEKPMSAFTTASGTRTSRCKPCLNQLSKDRQRQNPEKVRAEQKRYRTANLDKVRAAARAHYHANKAYYAAKNAEWIRENPMANRARRARYRANKLAAPGAGVSTEQWIALRDSYGCCIACMAPDGPLEPDHIVPLSQGGWDEVENIQPLCRACNAAKKDRFVDYRLSFTSGMTRSLPFTSIVT
ncbi:HNH endonuclease [Actinobacteria bacterium OV450]|nr:HNH endonuclease [Actinobacteria bacterium OV450]